VALTAIEPDRSWADLEEDRIDALVVSERLTPKDGVVRKLYDERFVLAQRKGHPRGRRPPDLDAFCALDHVLVSPDGGGFAGITDKTLKAMGRTRRVVASLPSFLLAPALIENSDAVGVLPGRLARLYRGTLDLFAPPIEIPGFAVQIVWHPRRQGDPAHRWLRGELLAAERQRRPRA
jgi:DNA-binding transcriptional LysR family regulator